MSLQCWERKNQKKWKEKVKESRKKSPECGLMLVRLTERMHKGSSTKRFNFCFFSFFALVQGTCETAFVSNRRNPIFLLIIFSCRDRIWKCGKWWLLRNIDECTIRLSVASSGRLVKFKHSRIRELNCRHSFHLTPTVISLFVQRFCVVSLFWLQWNIWKFGSLS